MEEPTDEELAVMYGPVLGAERVTLQDQTAQSAGSREIVQLDQQAIGRLSRTDALQGQALQKGLEGRRAARHRAITAALDRIAEGEFGFCEDCGDFIGHGRLGVDPCVMRCVACTV